MKSAQRGHTTSDVEVTKVSPFGFWLLLNERELFLPFKEFPWFEDATIREISSVELHGADHRHWPALDVDLTLDSIEHPDRYPLIARIEGRRVRETPHRSGPGKRRPRR